MQVFENIVADGDTDIPAEMEGYKTYIIHYNHAGSHWSLDIRATSMEDATARLEQLANNGKVMGELIERIPFEV